MPKTKLSEILKNGDKFELKEIDFDSPEFKKMIKAVKEEQKKCLARKKVNWNFLNRIIIR